MSPEPTGQLEGHEAASETVRPLVFPELPNILKNASKLVSAAFDYEWSREPAEFRSGTQLRRLAVVRDSINQTSQLAHESLTLREAEIYKRLKDLQQKMEEKEAGMESAFEPLLKFIREGVTND